MTADQNFTQPTLGEYLRQERERRGITIEQVASATKISVRLLHLLESDQYVELPAKPFIRGFVNSYCRFIGIDSKEVLIRYGTFLEERSHDRPTRDEGHSGYAFEKRDGEQSRLVLGIVMAAFVVVGGLAFVILKPSLKRHHNSHADKLRQANESPSPLASASPEASPSGSPTAKASPGPSASVSVEILPVPTAVPSVLAFSPSPSKSPKPVPTTEVPLLLRPPKTLPAPKPKPSPRSTPKPTPSVSPSPAPMTSEKPDPLNSGINLKPSEIKYKIVLKTSADVWVRYQVDARPRMKFILRAGKVLVLRAQQTIRFQTSQPDAISFRLNSGPERHVTGDSNTVLRGKDLTLFVPKELAETIQEPFPGERPLQGAFVPVGRMATPSPSPSR